MPFHIENEERLEPIELQRLQRTKLARLLELVRHKNPFYGRKLANVVFDPLRDSLQELPFTTRSEIQQDQANHPLHGTNLTFPLNQFTRWHQTSGSSGTALRWLDTPQCWQWWLKCWAIIYFAAGITSADRLMFPFSFGPFIGFWGAFEAAVMLGNRVIAGGGMTTPARLRLILESDTTAVCCTPTYALHLADVAASEGLDLPASNVRALIVAGEPGGNIPATRKRIEDGWGGRVFDHAGMTEVGPWGFECLEHPGGMHVMESEFIAEVIDPESGQVVDDGACGELVLTNLGRTGMPLVRYRTGDQVALTRGQCACGRWFARLEGGVGGRCDDMLFIRGNNVFPSVIEGIFREFSDVVEFRMVVDESNTLCDLYLEIEPRDGCDVSTLVERITHAVRDRLHFRPIVVPVEPGSLPRFEMKARRVHYGDSARRVGRTTEDA